MLTSASSAPVLLPHTECTEHSHVRVCAAQIRFESNSNQKNLAERFFTERLGLPIYSGFHDWHVDGIRALPSTRSLHVPDGRPRQLDDCRRMVLQATTLTLTQTLA